MWWSWSVSSVCLRKLLRISYLVLKTNNWVRSKMNSLSGSKATSGNVMRRNLKWFGHVTCLDSLAKTIFHGTLEGGRRRGRQRKCWVDDIKEWTFLPLNIWLCTRVTSRPDITSMTDWMLNIWLCTHVTSRPDITSLADRVLNIRDESP